MACCCDPLPSPCQKVLLRGYWDSQGLWLNCFVLIPSAHTEDLEQVFNFLLQRICQVLEDSTAMC